MSISPLLVEVSRIKCDQPNTFDPKQIKHTAHLILEMGGTINPMILCEYLNAGEYSYKIIDGVFTYYAAVEAKKIDPNFIPTINAFIIKKWNDPFDHGKKYTEEMYTEQIAIFRQDAKQSTPIINIAPTLGEQDMQQLLNALLPQIETTIKNQIDALEAKIETTIKNQIDALETRIVNLELNKDQNKPLQQEKAKPTIVEPIIVEPIIVEPIIVESPIINPFINFLNNASEQEIKELGGIPKNALANLIAARNKEHFKSSEDLIKCVNGIAKTTYDKLQNKWQLKKVPIATSTETTAATIVTLENVINDVPSETIPSIITAKPEQPLPLLLIDAPVPTLKVDIIPDIIAPATPAKVPLHGIDSLNNMSIPELASKLNRLKLGKELMNEIISQRPFASFEAMKISGLGPVKKQKIIDAFSN